MVDASSYSACKIITLFCLSRLLTVLTVYTVFLLETVQTALTGADVYYWFASGYGNLNRLATPFASAIDVPIMESIVAAMVQFFYAYRVWILSNKSWWICSLICMVGRSQAPFNRSHQVPPSS
jgi:hypothetical protein